MKTALEHLLAAIQEIEDRVASGHISRDAADDVIKVLSDLHDRLNRVEERLNERSI